MSNKLIEALEVHDELNPVLWDGMELKDEVKNKLLEIADTFIKGLEYPINVADIRFLGSNASFNYNENSDIDLHIISNFDLTYIDKNILQLLYNSSKNNFNNNHDISIHGIPVEIYVEDMNSMNATNGSYSLLKDEWVKIPKPIDYVIPDYSKELNDYLDEYNQVMKDGTLDEIEELINRIYMGRKDGLATEGEASIGNCVFKELRNRDVISNLRDRLHELESEELTLENKKLEEDVIDDVAVEMQDEPTPEQIKEKEDEYTEYIETHIKNVRKAYDRIVKDLIKDEFTDTQLKQLEDNLEVHDKDKYIPFMFDAYRRDHLPVNEKEKQEAKEDYDIAWDYHKHNNTHHWEYWLNSAGEFAQNIDEEAMKLAYAEMFCDWLSFGFRKEETSATGESTEFKTWYGENGKNIKIHPQLREWFDDKVDTIIKYIDENKDTIYKDKEQEGKCLTKFKNCNKIEEDDNINRGVGENIMSNEDKEKELKRMQEWVNKVLENRKLEESSMSKVAEYISHYQVGFITAFRQGNTKAVNQNNNHWLKLDIIQDLDKTKLSYIKVDGTYPEQKKNADGTDAEGEYVQIFEETFAVINDQYRSDDFIKIMCSLVKKYNQDSTLIVFPPSNDSKKIEDNITAAEYDGDGNKKATYKGFTVSVYDKYKDKNTAVEEYYTKVGNKKLSFTNRQEVKECIDKEPEYDVYTYRLKKQGNQGSMLESQRKHIYVEGLLNEFNKLEESSMSRILQLIQQGYFATVSADISVIRYAFYVAKDEEFIKLVDNDIQNFNKLDNQEEIESNLYSKYGKDLPIYNKEAYKQLQESVRNTGLGYVPIEGVYTYSDSNQESTEPSLFISISKDKRASFEDFKNTIIDIGNTYYQESVVIGNSDKSDNGDIKADNDGKITIDASLYDCETGSVIASEYYDTEYNKIKLSDFSGFLSRLVKDKNKAFAMYKFDESVEVFNGIDTSSYTKCLQAGGVHERWKQHINPVANKMTEKYSKLQEDYNDYRSKVKFDLEYRVIAPITVKQEDEFDTYGKYDQEMDIDIDSLYESYEDVAKQIQDLVDDEDLLKEIFPNVGLGRVYVGNIELDEDKLDFDIGFSSIVDPVERGNDIKLDEDEIKEQIKDLVICIIENVDYVSAKQVYTEYTGEVDEDGEPIEEEITSDNEISYSINLDKSKDIEIHKISE